MNLHINAGLESAARPIELHPQKCWVQDSNLRTMPRTESVLSASPLTTRPTQLPSRTQIIHPCNLTRLTSATPFTQTGVITVVLLACSFKTVVIITTHDYHSSPESSGTASDSPHIRQTPPPSFSSLSLIGKWVWQDLNLRTFRM